MDPDLLPSSLGASPRRPGKLSSAEVTITLTLPVPEPTSAARNYPRVAPGKGQGTSGERWPSDGFLCPESHRPWAQALTLPHLGALQTRSNCHCHEDLDVQSEQRVSANAVPPSPLPAADRAPGPPAPAADTMPQHPPSPGPDEAPQRRVRTPTTPGGPRAGAGRSPSPMSLPDSIVLVQASREDTMGDRAGISRAHGRPWEPGHPWQLGTDHLGRSCPGHGPSARREAPTRAAREDSHGARRERTGWRPWHFTAVSHSEHTKDDVTRRRLWVAPSNLSFQFIQI